MFVVDVRCFVVDVRCVHTCRGVVYSYALCIGRVHGFLPKKEQFSTVGPLWYFEMASEL